MPIADWGISRGTVEGFDRDNQEKFKPYTGPKPPMGVYRWRITKNMQFQPGDGEKFPRWSALLRLVPRIKAEKQYDGFTVWFSANVSDDLAFTYVPMLDALGISEREFLRRTMTDEEGNVKSIGKWRNDGKSEILAQIEQNGQYINVRWVGPIEDEEDYEDADDEELTGDDDDDF